MQVESNGVVQRAPNTVKHRGRSWISTLRPTRQEKIAALFLLPVLAFFLAFLVIPVLGAFTLAFQRWTMGGIAPNKWIGLGNYAQMTRDWRFWNSLRVTLTYAFGLVVIPYGLALPLALFLNMKIPGRGIFRALFFLPVVTPVSAGALVFVYLFNTDFGLVNSVLLSIGLVNEPIRWLGLGQTAIPATMMMLVWSHAGFDAVTLLAGLQVISQDVIESAMIDGASGWSLFRHITLPLLKPASIVVITFGLVNAFKTFGPIYVMTEGGPGKATEVMGLYLYQNAFLYWRLGYATAVGTIIALICLVINVVMTRVRHVDWV